MAGAGAGQGTGARTGKGMPSMLSEQDETPRSKDRSATTRSDGMLSVDREDERETARDEQECPVWYGGASGAGLGRASSR